MKNLNWNFLRHCGSRVSSLALVGTFLFAGVSHAQQATYIEIRNGEFYLNGKKLSAQQVPASLNTEGMDATFSFFGETTPVIEIKGRFFVIEGSSLREATEKDIEDGTLNVFLTDTDLHKYMIREAYLKQVADLQEKAKALDEYSSADQFKENQEVARVLSEAQQSAEQAAIMAAQLPRVDMQSYWDEVRHKNVELYDQFNNEWKMELQANDMAAQIRTMPASRKRSDLIEELRTTLEQIFALKQANRKREVVELQLQLEGLEKSMRDREKFKDEIIDRRLRDLLGEAANQ